MKSPRWQQGTFSPRCPPTARLTHQDSGDLVARLYCLPTFASLRHLTRIHTRADGLLTLRTGTPAGQQLILRIRLCAFRRCCQKAVRIMEDVLERRALLLHLGGVLQLIARLDEAAVSATNVEEVYTPTMYLENPASALSSRR